MLITFCSRIELKCYLYYVMKYKNAQFLLTEAMIGVRDRSCIPFPIMGLVPSKLINVLFLAQIVPSRVTRARTFY